MKIKKSLNFSILQFCNRNEGQSLAELLVALAVGGFLVISAAIATTVILKNETEAKNAQIATFLSQNEIDSVKSASQSNWLTLYSLQKGASTQYFVIPSATSTVSTTIISGKESVLADDVTNGLIGYWKFDEGVEAIAYDFSGNGYNGTSATFPIWMASSSCKAGNCLSFDGIDDFINLGNPAILNLGAQNFSLCAWFKTTDTEADIISNGISTNGDYLLMSYSGKLRGHIWYGGNSNVIDSVKTVNDNNWHHGCQVVDSAKIYLYIDGVYDNSQNLVGTKSGITATVRIGDRDGIANSNNFTGFIDDARIYNRALSAAEISQIYKSAVFNRYFSAENVNRDSCGVGNISTDAITSCLSGPQSSGVANDPSTQKITAHIEWQNGGNLSRTEYVSRSVNKIIDETDWSGGGGQSGITASPNGFYATSTGIATSTGSIRLRGL